MTLNEITEKDKDKILSTINKINRTKEIYKKEIFYTIDNIEITKVWNPNLANALINHISTYANNIQILNNKDDEILISKAIKYLDDFFNYLWVEINHNDNKGIFKISDENFKNLFDDAPARSIYWKIFINNSIFSQYDEEYKFYVLIHELIHNFTSKNINIKTKNYCTEMWFEFDNYIFIEWLTDFLAVQLIIKYYNKSSWNINASYFHFIKLIDYLLDEVSIKYNIKYDDLFKYLIKSFFIKDNNLNKILLRFFDKWFLKDLNKLWNDCDYNYTMENINTVLISNGFKAIDLQNIYMSENFKNLFWDFKVD